MISPRFSFKSFKYIVMTLAYGISFQAQSTVNLPDSPLFISVAPQANIMFAVDDSGSMDWEVLKSDGALLAHPSTPNSGSLDLSPNDDTEDLEFCVGYNVLAYDPNVTYIPWTGEDSAGVTFGDQSPTAARSNPYPTSSGTTNVTNICCSKSMIYGEWVDGFGGNPADGVYQNGECPTAGSNGSGYGSRNHSADSRFIFVNTLSAAEQTNFANWYSYYRKREYVLKRAMSELIDQSTVRLGLATLHNNNNVGTPIRDMTDTTNKEALEDEMFNINSTGGTPLRALLDNVGRYFDDTDGSGAPSALGFTESSPILDLDEGGECQQNYAVVMSDGYWNGSYSGVGNEDSDGDSSFDGGPHADSASNTLADIAMRYYETDLSSLDDNVPVIEDVDDNTAQHLVTYSVSFGLAGTGITDPVDHESTTPAPPWSNPITSGEGPERLDDMQHAAYNSRGLFLNAKDPQELINSFVAAFVDIDDRTSFSGSSVAINSTVLRTSSLVFAASFNSTDYSGELSAFVINSDGNIEDDPEWEASGNLPSAAARDIFTIVDKSGTKTSISFDDTDADLITAVGSADIINYIRGDQSNEEQNGGTLRDRDILIGDIVQSSPVSAGSDDFFLDILPGAEGSSYLPFVLNKTARYIDNNEFFSVVYVGTNGGVMMAVDSRDGGEIFAYAPESLHSELVDLTDPGYGHKFYLNSTGYAGDAYINSGGGTTWHTLYTSALGEGARALYMLDITFPFAFTANDVLWEVNDTNYPELGFVKHSPKIIRLNNGEWGVVVGNGYNSDSEKAQLFILDAEDGSLIAQLDTDTGGTGSNSTGLTNGLAEPALLDTNGDKIVDFIYAGDLLGNIWKFDISDTSDSNWNVAFSGNPLFTAVDDKGTGTTSDDTAQAITTAPVIARHPDGGFMVLVGTGKYLEASDKVVPANPDVETFYGIRDNGATVSSKLNDLVEQEILDEFDVTNTDGDFLNRVRVVSENTVDYTTKEGWYIDMITPPSTKNGERVIGNPLIRFGRAIFTTFIPSNSPCDIGGDSTIMEVDAVSGARLQNSVFDINNDGVIDASDFVNYNGTDIPGSGLFIPATTSSATLIAGANNDFKLTSPTDINEGLTSTMNSNLGKKQGRFSWQQVR